MPKIFLGNVSKFFEKISKNSDHRAPSDRPPFGPQRPKVARFTLKMTLKSAEQAETFWKIDS